MREAKRTREDQARPFVVVDVQPNEDVSWSILNLVIQNVGTTLARDVKIVFTPPLKTSQQGYDLAGSTLLREGIPTLPPRRRIAVLFDVSFQRVKTQLPMRYDAEVTFKDARGRQQETLRYIIDLGYLYGLQRVDQYGVHHMAKALRDIERTLKGWTGRQGRLNIWTRSEERHELAEKIEHDLTGRWPSLSTAPLPEIVMVLGRNVFVRSIIRAVRHLRDWRGTSTP